jgi:hypothetical protein
LYDFQSFLSGIDDHIVKAMVKICRGEEGDVRVTSIGRE